jgi:uncharacterized membrane protein
MTDAGNQRRQRIRCGGPPVVAIGLSHFLWPRLFDPINMLGFPDEPRKYTYINGAIETAIGVLLTYPRTRRLSGIVGAGYTIYLAGNVIKAQTMR